MRPKMTLLLLTCLALATTNSCASPPVKHHDHHESQAVSDAQVRQAQALLAGKITVHTLARAKAILERVNHDYKGHRRKAIKHIDAAMEALRTRADVFEHVKAARQQLHAALTVR